VAALDECGYVHEAARTLAFAQVQAVRLLPASSPYSTSRCASVSSSPTRTTSCPSPGTATSPLRPGGPRSTPSVRPVGVADLRAEQARFAVPFCSLLRGLGRPAGAARRCHRVSPGRRPGRVAVPVRSGVDRVLREMLAGLGRKAASSRSAASLTVDLGLIGPAAARLSGSGIGIGLQGKVTCADSPPRPGPAANIEFTRWRPRDARPGPVCSAPPPRGTQGRHSRPGQ